MASETPQTGGYDDTVRISAEWIEPQWRPRETLPIEPGAQVMGWTAGGEFVARAYHYAPGEWFARRDFTDYPRGELVDMVGKFRWEVVELTHWMPIPGAPK